MKHSIVLWDCTFRNFFHLLESLTDQDYRLDDVEVIFVEQRSREMAEGYAKKEDVRSIWDVAEDVSDRLNVRVISLDEPLDEPYHPGRLLNAGLQQATGEILSTMDADLLVPRNFLTVLDQMHDRGPRLITLHRYRAAYPCGTTIDDWKNQIIDYDLIRSTCPDAYTPVPPVNGNKAPLLSTRRETWAAIEGYEEHRLFATAYTLFGRDIALRFSLALGRGKELPMPLACVHPWHPTEVSRDDSQIRILYQAQQAAIEWSKNNASATISARGMVLQQMYRDHAQAIDAAIAYAERDMHASTHGQLLEPASAEQA